MADGSSERSVVVAFASGVALRNGSDVALVVPGGELTLASLPPFIVEALESLGVGVPVLALEDRLLDAHGMAGLAQWYSVLSLCEGARAVRYCVSSDGRALVTFTPAATGRTSLHPAPTGPLRLSRFAHLRRDGEVMLLDSPLARGRMEVLHPQVAAVIAALGSAGTPAHVAEQVGVDAEGWLGEVLSLLVAAGLVLHADSDGKTAEDRSVAAQHWEFADLVLHSRSRTSRGDLAVGGTYRLEERVPPPPPLKPPMSDDRIMLARPDLDALAASDEPFTRVMERRRSVRRHGDPPIDIMELGHFLHRSARVRPAHRSDSETAPRNRVRMRLYPGGGACHPLEIYPVISRCTGLGWGLYHYDPEAHALERLPDPLGGAASLLHQVSVPIEGDGIAQVMLVFTARFRRLSWKYEGNAYALLLQEVGVLYESMYLVATAMGLAPCAVGGGDAARFAAIIGTDPLEEASVGGFTLGRRETGG